MRHEFRASTTAQHVPLAGVVEDRVVADIDDGGLRFLKEKAPDDELRMVILVFGRNQNVHDSTTAAPHDLEICLVDLDLHGDTCESNVACFAGPRGTGLERDSPR